ncbi:MAG: addiction module protein [Candidatus Rokubacteria bacterium RIFCSPLOWO2_02_FULL_68_19]|nr:MAG: addiction module protein [Candidatus Rokubacteria bacterium RIFCSPLOWO2_02_FULL_68_19]OGL19557.1 MAG: addiction module protein [Candidatus Rokubacteria bacterium RIFCSPLOWO2_12_FULL_69_21]
MGQQAVNITSLSPDERLRLIADLWESLSQTPNAVPLTDAQREELDRRLDELERGEADGIPWDEVLRQVRRRQV